MEAPVGVTLDIRIPGGGSTAVYTCIECVTYVKNICVTIIINNSNTRADSLLGVFLFWCSSIYIPYSYR